ncbi:MAG TPA: GNAT family N-acetyltransferase [Micrococcaceae bacterium]
MAKVLSRVAPWLASHRESPYRRVRVLGHEDTHVLRDLVQQDPVSNVFLASQLESSGSAVPSFPGSVILGHFDDDGSLSAACWIGSNVVPVQAGADEAACFGRWIAASQRRVASIFGPAEAVLGIFDILQDSGTTAVEVRRNQPLLQLCGEPAIAGNPALRTSRPEEFARILPAAAAMFEEEVGYSPYQGGEDYYRRRVAALIEQGHSLSHLDEDGEVIFKADLGAVSKDVTQIQGVWLNPSCRGLGLSAGYMAATVRLALQFAPVTSLYVNDFNTRARATYERVGFRQVGTFATVLF